jgi:hypothetical protein
MFLKSFTHLLTKNPNYELLKKILHFVQFFVYPYRNSFKLSKILLPCNEIKVSKLTKNIFIPCQSEIIFIIKFNCQTIIHYKKKHQIMWVRTYFYINQKIVIAWVEIFFFKKICCYVLNCITESVENDEEWILFKVWKKFKWLKKNIQILYK